MVSNKNKILFLQFEEEVRSKQTIQRNSTMGDNAKYPILSQDMVRRLLNTSDSPGAETMDQVVFPDTSEQRLLRGPS